MEWDAIGYREKEERERERRKRKRKSANSEEGTVRVAVMLEAIYAWRRNGGMRWPSYERSDAIMDLRAASRPLNSFNRPLLILPQLRTIALTFSIV